MIRICIIVTQEVRITPPPMTIATNAQVSLMCHVDTIRLRLPTIYMRSSPMKKLRLVCLLFACFVYLPKTFANLRVMPTHAFLDDKRKSFKLSVKHNGNKAAWYSIKSVFYRMKPDGSVEAIPGKQVKEEERPALNLFRFSPRRVLLEPGKEQIIRLIVKRKKNLPDGEYRAHLYFVEDEDLSDAPKKGEFTKPVMALKSRVAIAVPVLYRHGNVELKVELSDFNLLADAKGGPQEFTLKMKTNGNGFAFGNLLGFFVPENGDEIEVMKIKGVSSYISERTLKYKFNMVEKPLGKGKIKIRFQEYDERGGKILGNFESQISGS